MERDEEVRAAILDRLKAIGAQPFQPINLYAIGTALVPAGFSEHEVGDAVIALHDRKVVEILNGNRIQLLAPAHHETSGNGLRPTA